MLEKVVDLKKKKKNLRQILNFYEQEITELVVKKISRFLENHLYFLNITNAFLACGRARAAQGSGSPQIQLPTRHNISVREIFLCLMLRLFLVSKVRSTKKTKYNKGYCKILTYMCPGKTRISASGLTNKYIRIEGDPKNALGQINRKEISPKQLWALGKTKISALRNVFFAHNI